MSGKILSCAYFDASDAYLNNRSHYDEALAKIGKVDGRIRSFRGIQVPEEGGKKGYIVTAWESAEHLKKFASTDDFTKASAIFQEAAVGEVRRSQIIGVVGAPVPPLEAAVTVVVLVHAKAGVSDDQIKVHAHKLAEAFNNVHHPYAFGESLGKDGRYLILGGWSSIAESRNAIKEEPYASSIAAFKELAEVEVTHAIFEDGP
ncbi:hypothetical protein BDP27DRAFT_1366738 [Rhodocollybia butyracea]|uniref:ABM domain-containing protein n=1 Tax=Rhodocollybia butyracea TaxID=206335 RepID=A0A9P5U3W3_9AGAR|nr:hypothetical protein BDP27DRAFT_1366738 [Rhodocollybia butyracea]